MIATMKASEASTLSLDSHRPSRHSLSICSCSIVQSHSDSDDEIVYSREIVFLFLVSSTQRVIFFSCIFFSFPRRYHDTARLAFLFSFTYQPSKLRWLSCGDLGFLSASKNEKCDPAGNEIERRKSRSRM